MAIRTARFQMSHPTWTTGKEANPEYMGTASCQPADTGRSSSHVLSYGHNPSPGGPHGGEPFNLAGCYWTESCHGDEEDALVFKEDVRRVETR